MYVIMRKLEENHNYVNYSFETKIWEPTGQIDRRGFPVENLRTVSGFCKFNKITQEFIVDKIKTDKYFLTKEYKMILWVEAQLQRFHDSGKAYPEIYDIARG